eukprot:14959-Heterococcus_DN1.PRE.4
MLHRLERKLCTFVTYAAVISCVAAAAAATITVQNPISGITDPHSNPYKELNQWVNSFIMPGASLAWAERVFGAYTAHFVIMYVRDLVAATIIYYTTNSLWHLYIYKIKKDQFFPNGKNEWFATCVRHSCSIHQPGTTICMLACKARSLSTDREQCATHYLTLL